MLSLFRKHQYGILLVVAIVVIIAFAFLYDPNRQSLSMGDAMMTVYGKEVRQPDVQRMERSAPLLASLGEREYAIQLFTLDTRFASTDPGADNPYDIAANSLILREEAKRLGIAVPNDLLSETIMAAPALQENGQFHPRKWEDAKNVFKSQGFNEQAVRGLVRDAAAYKQLRALITAGVTPSPREVQNRLDDTHSKVFASTITIPKSDFEADVTVTDEEIQAHFDANRDLYKTDEARAVAYIYFPKPVKQEAGDGEGAGTDATGADGDGEGNVDAADASSGSDSDTADSTGESDEEFKARVQAHMDALSEFDTRRVDPEETATFEELASEDTYAKWAEGGLVTTEAFSQFSPPEPLQSKPELVQAVFATRPDREQGHPVTTADGYYFFKLLEVKEPGPKPLEDVRSDIEETLKEQKLTTAVNEAAATAKTAITEALEAGKPIPEAATSAGYEATEVPMFTATQTPAVANGYQIRTTAGDLAPGELSTPIETPTGAILIYLDSRELPLDIDIEAQKVGIRSSLRDQDRQALFLDWFRARKDEANPTPIR